MPRPDRPTRPRTGPPSSGDPTPDPPRDPRPSDAPPQIVLISSGLAIFLGTLWLGVAVIRDTPLRSAVMAGLVLAIAAAGYVFTHPQRPGGH